MNCINGLPVRLKHCADVRDEGHSECAQNRDDGYNSCAQYRDNGYNSCGKWDSQCCDWWPCSWACRLVTWVCLGWYWVSSVVCVAWYWVSNVVCVAWQWIKNLVCIAWDLITFVICIFLTVIVALVNFVTGGYLGKLIDLIIGAKRAPDLVTPRDAKEEVNREGATGNPYEHLSGFDSFIAWFTTSVFKENGISGWTSYLIEACATGKVIQAVWNSDGLYTVDIEMSREDDGFVARLPGREFEDGIERTRWIRAEIELYKIGLHTTLPMTNQRVTICGRLFWDADGFLEIHPESAADIRMA